MKLLSKQSYPYLLLLGIFLSAELHAQHGILIPYRKGQLWGFADTSLKIRIIPNYDSVGFFYYDRALVKLNHKVGYINQLGEEIIPLQFDRAGSFGMFGQAYAYNNGKRHCINRMGEDERELAGCGGSYEIADWGIIIDKKKWKI